MLERDGFQSKVPTSVIEQAVSNLNGYITAHYEDPSRGTLKTRQMTVFEDLRDTLRRGQTEGYVAIPTGVGKTVLFIEFVEATKLSTLIVVPTTILVGQTGDKFQEFAPDVEIGMLYSRKHDLTKPVTITTYASLVRNINNGTLDPHLFQLLVLDEVHRSLSQKRKLAVIAFGKSIKLGFTATPVYSKDRQVANLLNTEVHKMSVREAIERDLLSPFSAYIAESDVDLSNVSITSKGDYDQKELEQAINIASRNQAAVDLYQQLFPGQTAVAYCVSIKHAQELASLFFESGVPAGYISGIQSKKEQEELLRQFKNGQIRVLCNADILIEGFDEPKASVCLNVRPTRSVVVAQQRAGRVLRLDPDNSNKHACIVDFLDKTQDPRKQPVIFAEVAEAAIILSKNEDYVGSGGRGRHGPIIDSVIQISGLRVTINPEEVLRIVKEIQEKGYQFPPEGWLFVGDVDNKNSLSGLLSRTQKWVKAHLPQILKELEEEEKKVISIKDRRIFSGKYTYGKSGPITYYSPEVLEKLMLMDDSGEIPKGWLVIGDMRIPGTLAYILGRSAPWIKEHLPQAIDVIQSQYEERGVAPDDREELLGTFLDNRHRNTTFYSPVLVEELRKLSVEVTYAPTGWLTIGNKTNPDTMSNILGKTPQWIKSRLPQALTIIESEQNRLGIEPEEREKLFGDYLKRGNKQPARFYSPRVLEILKTLVE